MVNMPPIPPLVCSTPPPIDFGEDDEDMDIMPPSLDDVEDDFGGFLIDDGIKNDEPLPSPRPPSVCDIPSISIYDGLIPPEEEGQFTKNTDSSSQQTIDAKKITKSKTVTEAFNFQVKNSTTDEKKKLHEEVESPVNPNKTAEQITSETELENAATKIRETEQNSRADCAAVISQTLNAGVSRNVKNLSIEPVNDEGKSCAQHVVSIEDVEDDLSDDELYSPKTPKNFTETDNMTDFFKIEEIKTATGAGNNLEQDAEINNSGSSKSKDNNKTASLYIENGSEFKSFPSSSFIENRFDTPPPLTDDLNHFDNEVDDEFGDYADFQETNFVNNVVPVEDSYTNQHKSDLEANDLNSFASFYNADDFFTTNNSQIDGNIIEHYAEENEKSRKDFENLPSKNPSEIDKFVVKGEEKAEKNVDLQITLQESHNNKVDSLNEPNAESKDHKNNNKNSCSENIQPVKQFSQEDNSLSDLSEVAAVSDNDDFGNFAEFSCMPPHSENLAVKTSEAKIISFSHSDDDDGDEFGDFADFESIHKAAKAEEVGDFPPQCNSNPVQNDDDDDDFGDFNTAEPCTTTTSTSMATNTSQNINLNTPIVASNNLNERISKILQLMFSPKLAEDILGDPKADKIQDIPFTSIDAAKALEYQWLNSDTRHSFIRSLGIDSRNILYGDNWNPSLPRFAANLSFNPLKPMKPLPSTGNTVAVLEPIPVATAETNQTIEISRDIKKEPLDLDWKPSMAEEQTTEAFKDNKTHAPTDVAASMAYTSNELQTAAPESLAIFESSSDSEGNLSKTPPISEMESVSSFATPLPSVTMDMELSTPQPDLEENANSLDISEVVVTSTFTGSFKETHIYTPPKTNEFEVKHAIGTPPTCASSPAKSSPIDFDYEKAAMGVIIDETVVKKEYRDVEYNPPFSIDSLSKSVSPKMEFFEANSYSNKSLTNLSAADKKEGDCGEADEDSNDDFSEFQSVSSEVVLSTTSMPSEAPKTNTVSHGGMILSPAILIPQAISMENHKPKIEWGDATATINPEELARIEELFPEPKSLKSSSSSQKSTPIHQAASAPSISATVASKELEGNMNNINDDDDDWSDFVSVSVTNNVSANRTGINNNVSARSPVVTPFQSRSPTVINKIPTATVATPNNSNNDDEWSDFVSSAPPMQQPNTYRVPQFNSGAWQNANFYNNPLSMYHKGPLNIPTTAPGTHSAQKYMYNNNNNYPMANNMPPAVMASTHHQLPHNSYKQQIHVMQNFSTAPVPTPDRLSAAAAAAAANKNNQFQSIGSAKVAPSIALIPDLGFVAPAIPTHTSFINSLPKPSINMKK